MKSYFKQLRELVREDKVIQKVIRMHEKKKHKKKREFREFVKK